MFYFRVQVLVLSRLSAVVSGSGLRCPEQSPRALQSSPGAPDIRALQPRAQTQGLGKGYRGRELVTGLVPGREPVCGEEKSPSGA